MAWTAINPVAIGAPTKKSHYDKLWDNVDFIYAFLNSCSLTDHGILLGSGTNSITPLGVATNGQLLIGRTGLDPVLATLTSTDLTITNGAGSVSLAVAKGFVNLPTLRMYATGAQAGWPSSYTTNQSEILYVYVPRAVTLAYKGYAQCAGGTGRGVNYRINGGTERSISLPTAVWTVGSEYTLSLSSGWQPIIVELHAFGGYEETVYFSLGMTFY